MWRVVGVGGFSVFVGCVDSWGDLCLSGGQNLGVDRWVFCACVVDFGDGLF